MNNNVPAIMDYLRELFPQAECELRHRDNFELLISVILSAQCTDKRVNTVTPELFSKYPSPESLGQARQEDVERIIKPCGFYHNKAKSIIECSRDIAQRFDGKVPEDFDDLTSLRGVGRKTASVVTVVGFNEPAMPVDTHVFRVSNRLGIGDPRSVLACEKKLRGAIPVDDWTDFHSLMVLFGRYHCKAIRPNCNECKLKDICNYYKSKIEV